MNTEQQLQYLWQVIDQLNTAAQDVKQGHLTGASLPDYVLRRTTEAMQTVPYPGEPPDAGSHADVQDK